MTIYFNCPNCGKLIYASPVDIDVMTVYKSSCPFCEKFIDGISVNKHNFKISPNDDLKKKALNQISDCIDSGNFGVFLCTDVTFRVIRDMLVYYGYLKNTNSRHYRNKVIPQIVKLSEVWNKQ